MWESPKQIKPTPKTDGGDRNHLGESPYRAAQRQGERRDERANADGAHQKAEGVRAAVKNSDRQRRASAP